MKHSINRKCRLYQLASNPWYIKCRSYCLHCSWLAVQGAAAAIESKYYYVVFSNFFRLIFWCDLLDKFQKLKEYFPNLLENWFWGQIFVYWARYFKFWLLVYFLILLNCAKFEKDWTTFILHILQGSPLWCFFVFVIYQKFKGGTLVKCVT